jgi:hypothetical protein
MFKKWFLHFHDFSILRRKCVKIFHNFSGEMHSVRRAIFGGNFVFGVNSSSKHCSYRATYLLKNCWIDLFQVPELFSSSRKCDCGHTKFARDCLCNHIGKNRGIVTLDLRTAEKNVAEFWQWT